MRLELTKKIVRSNSLPTQKQPNSSDKKRKNPMSCSKKTSASKSSNISGQTKLNLEVVKANGSASSVKILPPLSITTFICSHSLISSSSDTQSLYSNLDELHLTKNRSFMSLFYLKCCNLQLSKSTFH